MIRDQLKEVLFVNELESEQVWELPPRLETQAINVSPVIVVQIGLALNAANFGTTQAAAVLNTATVG
jgi:hypothetical protein